MANGGFFQIEEGQTLLQNRINEINASFDQIVEAILDPVAVQEADVSNNPFFAQGRASMERLRWAYRSGSPEDLKRLGFNVKVIDRSGDGEPVLRAVK